MEYLRLCRFGTPSQQQRCHECVHAVAASGAAMPQNVPMVALHDVHANINGGNFSMTCRDDEEDGVSRSLHRQRTWDKINTILVRETLTSTRQGATHKGTFLDVGANLGWFSHVAAQVGAQVIAFEPNKDNRWMYRHSMCMNRKAEVVDYVLHPFAVGNVSRTCTLFQVIGSHNLQNTQVDCTDRAPPPGHPAHLGIIDMIRIDDVILHPVDVMKIDIEGHEQVAQDGYAELFDRASRMPRLVVSEFQPAISVGSYGRNPLDYIDFFLRRGYSARHEWAHGTVRTRAGAFQRLLNNGQYYTSGRRRNKIFNYVFMRVEA